ncbi:Poly [ADP-ribose] polymerase tankyrase (dTNKS) (Poly [ADP-ribose] polymerase) (Protein poly-ADP-ribosyltransferase tankyrase) [Durusdinium trenchii]
MTICSAIGGVVGAGMIVFGALTLNQESVGLIIFGTGIILYLFHLIEALCRSKTSKYLCWILSETDFQGYVKELQEAEPKIKWTIQCYHYETKQYTDSNGKQQTKRERVNTHRAEQHYDINGFVDETLSPAQMIAMFHLMYDGEHEDLEANKKAPISSLILLCEMPLEYHPVDDEEDQRLSERREIFFRDNTRDSHQDKRSHNLIDCHHKSNVMVILREGTDDSHARPWWMTYWFYMVCTIFLMSVPYRCYFFSKCTKINWEVLKHFSHKHEELWEDDPKHSRAKRTDAASKAFRKVQRETPKRSFELREGAKPAWEEGKEGKEELADVGPPVELPVGVPSYWKNQDLEKDFDEKINLSADEREKMQKLLDVTYKNKATRDRMSDGMPTRLVVNQVVRMEDSKMWRRFEQKRAELAVRGQPKLMEEMPGSGPIKTSAEADAEELPSCLKELTVNLNEAFLFHGSSPGGALGIGENGFDMGRVGSNVGTMFGAGAYLAEASSKSDEYATEDPSGLFAGKFALLLCRTLLGNMFYITESNIPRIEDALATGRFQCVLGDREAAVDTYREFVVFDEAQIYPEFVLIYTRSFD